MELRKILTGRFAPHLLRLFEDCGLAGHCGLPAQLELRRFEAAFVRAGGAEQLLPASSLGCLLKTEEEVRGRGVV